MTDSPTNTEKEETEEWFREIDEQAPAMVETCLSQTPEITITAENRAFLEAAAADIVKRMVLTPGVEDGTKYGVGYNHDHQYGIIISGNGTNFEAAVAPADEIEAAINQTQEGHENEEQAGTPEGD